MPRPRKKEPSYRLHKATGQAVVTLADPQTGKRRDYYLGKHGTAESYAAYAELRKQFEEQGQVVDGKPKLRRTTRAQATVGRLLIDFFKAEKARLGLKDDDNLRGSLFAKRSALRTCRQVCGTMPVDEFGPLRLQEVREAFVKQQLSRKTVNQYVRYVIAAFKWGVAQERVKSEVVNSLQCVQSLRKGEASLPENAKVKPVPEEAIEAIRPHVADQVLSCHAVQLESVAGVL